MQAPNSSFKLISSAARRNTVEASEAVSANDFLANRQPGSILHSTRLSLVGQARPAPHHHSTFQAQEDECRDAVGVILSGLTEAEITEMLDATFTDLMNDVLTLPPSAYGAAGEDDAPEKNFALL